MVLPRNRISTRANAIASLPRSSTSPRLHDPAAPKLFGPGAAGQLRRGRRCDRLEPLADRPRRRPPRPSWTPPGPASARPAASASSGPGRRVSGPGRSSSSTARRPAASCGEPATRKSQRPSKSAQEATSVIQVNRSERTLINRPFVSRSRTRPGPVVGRDQLRERPRDLGPVPASGEVFPRDVLDPWMEPRGAEQAEQMGMARPVAVAPTLDSAVRVHVPDHDVGPSLGIAHGCGARRPEPCRGRYPGRRLVPTPLSHAAYSAAGR